MCRVGYGCECGCGGDGIYFDGIIIIVFIIFIVVFVIIIILIIKVMDEGWSGGVMVGMRTIMPINVTLHDLSVQS